MSVPSLSASLLILNPTVFFIIKKTINETTNTNTTTEIVPKNCAPKETSPFVNGTANVPHTPAGVWGTLAVPLTNGDVSFGAQFLGTISVVVFVFVVSFIVFLIMKNTVGLRISKEAERLGTDKAEVGVIAYGIRD